MNDWKMNIAAIMMERLEWYDNEAAACCDVIEAGKYRHECGKLATALIMVLKLQTANREATLLELAALRGADRPMATATHRALLFCKDSMTSEPNLTGNKGR